MSNFVHSLEMMRTAASSARGQHTTDKPIEPDTNPPGVAPAATGLATPPNGSWTKIHWVLLLVALVLLVLAGKGQHFFYDEWAFVGGKLEALTLPDRYLMPHNEHWTLLPLMAYRTLGATVGVGSYWPYLGLLLLLHLGVTHILWRLMLATGSKPIVATLMAAVFSVLGAAAEDLVWAFQISFVGSTLLGVSAVYLAVTGTANWRRTAALASLILASLATSGVGLGYLIVVPFVLARRNRRYAFAAFGLPMLVYATWYAMYGRSLTHAPSASAALPLLVGAFVTFGLTAALTGYFGFDVTNVVFWLFVGVPILASLTLACRSWRADRTLVGRTLLAMCLGAVAFFGSAGLARGGLGLGIATSGRYVYVAIALVLPGIALVISNVADRHPRLSAAMVPIAIAVALSNVNQLFAYAADTRQDNNASRRVLVAASELVRSNSGIFIDQLPEPLLAPDLTTTDLRSTGLDPAFEGVSPGQSDRLTASLNLQVRVAPIHNIGTDSACRTPTIEQRITIPTSQDAAPTFLVTGTAPVKFTLSNGGVTSAKRLITLTKGTYLVNSRLAVGDLTIESTSHASRLAKC